MSIGDYYIFGLLVILLSGIALYAFFAMFSGKNRGAWDANSLLIGKLRAQKYGYKDYAENAQQFLLPKAAQLSYWPAFPAAAGHHLVTNNRGLIWRSCGIYTAGKSDLYFTFEVTQRSDGSEYYSPEISFQSLAEKHSEQDLAALPTQVTAENAIHFENWAVHSENSETVAAYLAADFPQWLVKIQGFRAVHFQGKNVTLVLPAQEFTPVLLQLYPQLMRAGKAVGNFLPKKFWQ